MTEPAIKTRVLTKVRRQFLHKTPPENGEAAENTTFIATPEQLNENTFYLLEPSLGLVETNRNIYAGHQFLNSHYKIAALRIERPFLSQTVTLDLQTNHVDMLPWEYCAERLESYGDLELATWASRLKTYHHNYSQMMKKYLDFINSRNPETVAAIAKGKEQAKLACRDIESRYVYRKVIFYANNNNLIPISLTLHEELLKDMGHTVDSFADWTKKHGIPGLFKRDGPVVLGYCKLCLARGDGLQSFFQEGPEVACDLYDKKGEKKPTRIKVFSVMHPAPEGFFISLYSVRQDPDPEAIAPKSTELDDILPSKKNAKSETE